MEMHVPVPEGVSKETVEIYHNILVLASLKQHLEVGLFQGGAIKQHLPLVNIVKWADDLYAKIYADLKARPDAEILVPDINKLQGIQGAV